MLLALIFCQLSVIVSANPFHKYPFVFLLDVGNEELEKTNSEQIRLSVPGGSVALRYPAIGDGNTIGHIRVSGIDFGTDLKANIVDGGPGYKYVVLVFMGNPGVPYDAVVTVQTVVDQAFNTPDIRNVTTGYGASQVEEDANNSAEDLSDDPELNEPQSGNDVQSSNNGLLQPSSNVYNYAENEVISRSAELNEVSSRVQSEINDAGPSDELDGEEYVNQESESSNEKIENDADQRDVHQEYTDDIDQIENQSAQVRGIDDDSDDNYEEISPELAQSETNDYLENDEPISVVDSKFNGLKPHLNGGEVYYEEDAEKNSRPDYQPIDYDDPDEIEPFFNDGEIHNEDKYKDSNNNNYIDSDDSYAIAY